MKTLHRAPTALNGHDAGRGLPPGGGMVIAVGLSFLVWGTIAWEVLH
jgi:hypothetical protein